MLSLSNRACECQLKMLGKFSCSIQLTYSFITSCSLLMISHPLFAVLYLLIVVSSLFKVTFGIYTFLAIHANPFNICWSISHFLPYLSVIGSSFVFGLPVFCQMNMDFSVADGHLCNMGRMIEEMESKLRNSLDQVIVLLLFKLIKPFLQFR